MVYNFELKQGVPVQDTTETTLNPGDVVRSKITGNFYTVVKVIGPHWFTHNQGTRIKLVEKYDKISQNWTEQQKHCTHSWVDVGFRFTKEVCSHCDVEKG